MSFRDLQLSIQSNKREFVNKIYSETIVDANSITNDIYNNNSSNISRREFRKNTFLSLVTENDKLLENEKEYCKKKYTYEFELNNALYKWGEQKECNKCKLTRYSEKFCENCISLHLQELFNTWKKVF